MGILNLTDDSFSADGLARDPARARRVREMEDAGADLIDIGAESTRPGAAAVSVPRNWRGSGPCCAPSAAARGSRCNRHHQGAGGQLRARRRRVHRERRQRPGLRPGMGPAGRGARRPRRADAHAGSPDDMYAHARYATWPARWAASCSAQWNAPSAMASAGIGSCWIPASASRSGPSTACAAGPRRGAGRARPTAAGRSVTQVVPHRRDGPAARRTNATGRAPPP